MDPVSSSISSVFGLLATFFQERAQSNDSQKQATIQEYLEWLRRRDHEQAVSMLEGNRELMSAIQQLLNSNHEELLNRFDRLEDVLNLVLGSTADWGEIVRTIDRSAGLSPQAFEILQWLDSTGGSMAAKVTSMEGGCLVSNGRGKNYSPTDSRFFDDDLMTLVSAGLLIPDFGSNGTPNYKITRAAVSLVKRPPSSD